MWSADSSHCFLLRVALVCLLVLCQGCERTPQAAAGPYASASLPRPAFGNAPPDRCDVIVHGAAGEVGGSLSIVDMGTSRWMVDCGAYYPTGSGTREERELLADRRNQELPNGAPSVSGVFVTHAHLDHIGRLPKLIRDGYRGPIYATRATAELAAIMLCMQIRYDELRLREWSWSDGAARRGDATALHWAGCEWQQRIRRPMRRRATLGEFQRDKANVYPCKTCGLVEAQGIASQFIVETYAQPFEIGSGVKVTLLDAGHIPGSASVLFEVDISGVTRRILFSGDLGNQVSTLVSGPDAAPAVDAVLVESTYGGRRHDAIATTEFAAFRRAVGAAVASGGVAWIPCFALDRTQKVLHQLKIAQEDGTLPGTVPIYCPSPSAHDITKLYRSWLRAESPWFRTSLREDAILPSSLIHDGGAGTELRPERPSVLLTTSGMLDAALSQSLLPSLLSERTTHVFLVGWQDPLSPGGQLASGTPTVEADGRQLPVRAAVHKYDCFSAHADASDIQVWLSRNQKAQVVLVHGDRRALSEQEELLRSSGWSNVTIAEPGKIAVQFP